MDADGSGQGTGGKDHGRRLRANCWAFIWAIGIKAEAACSKANGSMMGTERTKAKAFPK